MKGKSWDILISIKRSKLKQNSLVSVEFIVLIKYISPVGMYSASTTSPYTDKLKTSKCLKFSIRNFFKSILFPHVFGL